MEILFLTNIISPHQLPLADEMKCFLGDGNYTYLYTESLHNERAEMQWPDIEDDTWHRKISLKDPQLRTENLLFITHHRDAKLIKSRNQANLKTIFAGERWFRPPFGFFRLLSPRFLKMAITFVRAIKSPNVHLLPVGIHAARDFLRIERLLKGDLRALFRAPKVAFESRPGGAIVTLKDAIKQNLLTAEAIAFGKRHGFTQIPQSQWGKAEPKGFYKKLSLWGYFIKPSTQEKPLQDCNSVLSSHNKKRLKILWVGRMLNLKRVDTLIKACLSNELRDVVELHLYGHGPEEPYLRQLTENATHIHFHDFVSMDTVRLLMQQHDIYILPSDGGEGWGAVINEALEEGMMVYGTIQAGASATMLPPSHLYCVGDINALIRLLMQASPILRLEPWTVQNARDFLIHKFEQLLSQ